jgi:hypothetical protein
MVVVVVGALVSSTLLYPPPPPFPQVANSDIVLCVPAVTKDTTAHLGVSATASVFTKREHTDVSEFMVPSGVNASAGGAAVPASARHSRLVEGSSRVYPVGLVVRDRASLESPYLEHGVWARAEDWQVWHHGRDLGPAARAKLMGIPVDSPAVGLPAAAPAALPAGGNASSGGSVSGGSHVSLSLSNA